MILFNFYNLIRLQFEQARRDTRRRRKQKTIQKQFKFVQIYLKIFFKSHFLFLKEKNRKRKVQLERCHQYLKKEAKKKKNYEHM